jgi:hypothetical protein
MTVDASGFFIAMISNHPVTGSIIVSALNSRGLVSFLSVTMPYAVRVAMVLAKYKVVW